jgi:hypothetical protein
MAEPAEAIIGPVVAEPGDAESPSDLTGTLTSSATPATLGRPITFTVSIRSSVPDVPPTGTVAFLDGERILGTSPLDEAGQARITVADLAAGDHDMRADYSGDISFAPSTATLHQTVGRATTRTTVVSSAASGASGAVVTFEATVSSDMLGAPTGSVTFRDGTTVLGTAELNPGGVARFTADLGWGSHTIATIYGGDDVFGPSLTTVTHIVLAKTATTLWIDPSRSSYGDPVTLTATVRSAASGPVTGDVTFFDGSTTLGIVPLDAAGEARLSTPSLAAGEHLLRADYDGAGHLAPSSAEAPHQVDRAATTAIITAFVAPPAEEQ